MLDVGEGELTVNVLLVCEAVGIRYYDDIYSEID